MKLPEFFEEDRLAVDAHLERLMPAESVPPNSIHAAMRYSVFAGGKRIRPILCLETSRIFGEDVKAALYPACAIEFIHTYSLIHDDLPALDNDDLRRGKPTSHKKFGEAIAILAGDGLLTLAFETIGASPVAAERRVAMLTEISTAAGTVNGMVGGQVADIESEGKKVGPEILEYIHRSKTAALIRASITAGALSAGAADEDVKRLRTLRRNDWLGVPGDGRYFRRRRILRGAGKNSGQGHRSAEGDVSGGLWTGEVARDRERFGDESHRRIAAVWKAG